MLGNHSTDLMRRQFADQFEPDGPDFLYRRNPTAPPVRVSGDEYRGFLASYSRYLRISFWVVVLGIPVTIAAAVLYAVRTPGTEVPTGFIWAAVVVVGVAFVGGSLWARGAPARALRYRLPAGLGLSKDQVRSRFMSKLTYRQLAIPAVAAPLLLLKVSAHDDILHGWGRLWIAFALAIELAAGVQLLRKWRFDRQQR